MPGSERGADHKYENKVALGGEEEEEEDPRLFI